MNITNLNIEARKHYKSKIFDEEEFQEDIQKAYLAKKFLIKLDANKDVNITLLRNHIICLYNSFDEPFVTTYLYSFVDTNLKPYLKTILLYLHKIKIDNKLFSDITISYDFDYLLRTI